MPKLKTHKGTKARVKITGRGKVVAMRSGKRHLNHKSGKRIRQAGPISSSPSQRQSYQDAPALRLRS